MNESERNVQQMWRSQPPEEGRLSLETIRVRAEHLERNVRRMNIGAAALLTILIGVEAWQVWRTPELLERVGDR